jgi:hypothetical protein
MSFGFGNRFDEFDDPPSTQVMVKCMNRRRRRDRLIGVLVVGLIGYGFWAYSHNMGLKQTDNKAVAITQRLPYVKRGGGPTANPDSPTARVHLALTHKAAVKVDHKPVGQLKFGTLELSPGEHVIDVHVKDGVLRQTMVVEAGEELNVRFDLGRRKMSVRPVVMKASAGL